MPTVLEEKGGCILTRQLPGFYVPSLIEKKRVLSWLGIDRRFVRSFDGLRLKVPTYDRVDGPDDFSLIEMKVTEKYLPDLGDHPKGFFFGMTENEEMLMKVLGPKACLCLVSVHPDSEGYFIANWDQLNTLDMNKRIQYQITIR